MESGIYLPLIFPELTCKSCLMALADVIEEVSSGDISESCKASALFTATGKISEKLVQIRYGKDVI